jgi:hypothetical protein
LCWARFFFARVAAAAKLRRSSRLLFEVFSFRRGDELLFGQIFQHLSSADAAADFVPAAAVESGFVTVYSGHIDLLPVGG